MNEQQLAAVKQALELMHNRGDVGVDEWIAAEAALHSIISQDALDKKAENARELGLNYDTPLSAFVRSSDEDKAEVMERVIDKAIEAQKAVIGCVNHDCDKCKAVQEPVSWRNAALRVGEDLCSVGPFGYYDMTAEQWLDWALSVVTVHAPPAAQRQWVGLTTEEIYACDETSRLPQHEITNADLQAFAYAIEAKLKEKNQ
jgi:hypothetical protein